MSNDIQALAKLARPQSEEDWGSDRQLEAENNFWIQMRVELGDEADDAMTTKFESSKMDIEEMIDYALTFLGDDCKLTDQEMTFEQFQATRKKHANTIDSMWEHTDSDSTAKQAYIYLANDNSYDPTKHHSNYFHIEITPNGYEAMLDRTLWETTDLEAIERAMFDMLVEWGEIS